MSLLNLNGYDGEPEPDEAPTFTGYRIAALLFLLASLGYMLLALLNSDN